MADDVVPDLAEARRRLDAALAAGEPASVAHARMVLGAALYEQRHQLALALEEFVRAEAVYDDLGDAVAADMARLNRARALSGLGRADEAVAIYEAVAAGGGDAVGPALHGLAEHHDGRHEADLADAALDRLRAQYERHSPGLLPEHGYVAARRLLDRGDHEAASAAFAALVPLFADAGDRRRVGDCELSCGVAHHHAGDAHQAEDAYRKAVVAYTAVGDVEAAASAQGNLDVLLGS